MIEPQEDIKDREMTPEEYQLHKDKLLKYYEEEIPFLTKSHEHQRLITEMEEFRARYLRAQVMIANIVAGPPEPNPNGNQDKPIRTLKKEPV